MAETTTQGTGALASVTNAFKDLVNQATPVVSSYFDYKASRENAKANTGAAYAGGNTNSAGAASAPAPAGASITSKPWFPWAIGGVVLVVVGLLVFALTGRRGK